MTDLVVRAEGGIIWLVVGVFWVIAQIAGAAAKKNQPRPPPSDTGEESRQTEDPIAELLRKMAGVQEFRVEPPKFVEEPAEPVFTPKPARRNEARTKNPWKPDDIAALPDIEPLRREIMGQKGPPPAPVKIPEIDIRPKMSAFRSSVQTIRLPTLNLSFQGSATSIQNAPNLGKILSPSDKSSLRRAMLSHIIFSPPKALSRTSE
ncbi:MAG: hypothetical protein WCH86_00955 [Kiritimatiellales bacterium]